MMRTRVFVGRRALVAVGAAALLLIAGVAGATESSHGDGSTGQGHGEEAGAGAHGETGHAEVAGGEHGEAGSHGGYHAPTPHWNEIGAAAINFAIFFAALFWIGGRMLPKFFRQRRDTIAENIDKAQALRRDAEAKMAELEKKVAGLDAEREKLLREYREIGELEKSRILADAKSQAEKMRRDAENLIEQEYRVARERLREQVVDEAMARAAERIERQMTPTVQSQLVAGYARQIAGTAKN